MKKISSNSIAIVAAVISLGSLIISLTSTSHSKWAEFHSRRSAVAVSLGQHQLNMELAVFKLGKCSKPSYSTEQWNHLTKLKEKMLKQIQLAEDLLTQIKSADNPSDIREMENLEIEVRELEIETITLCDRIDVMLNKMQNQRLEPIVKTPVESGNVKSTQAHP